jgi:hypothetical protein
VDGGIVEQGGVLKENLLTNSGFDVWSNSTLENVTGSNLVVSWANVNWDTFTASGADVTDAQWTSSGAQYADSASLSLTSGKLYKLTATVSLTSGTLPWLYMQSPNNDRAFGQLAEGSNVFVFEADSGGHDDDHLAITQNQAVRFSCTFTLQEVTPGCVAANALAVDGWMKEATTDIWREHNGTYTKDGSFYSLKVTAGSANDYLIWTMDGNNTWVVGDPRLHKFDGRTVTMGVWAKTDTASHARIQLQDAGGTNGVNTYSDYHTGGNSWEWLEVTKTFNSDAAERYIYLRAEVDTKTIYYSQPILVFGSSIGEGNYTRPQGEWVYCEKEIPLNNYDGSSYSTASAVINMEAESNGMIPKGCKAVRVTSLTRDSGASGGACSAIYRPYTASMTGQLYNNIGSGALELGDSDIYYNSGQVACDSNGDIHGALTATGSSTLSVWFKPHAVQLR